jgi:putative membrane-bound dehydrogenase-like protein
MPVRPPVLLLAAFTAVALRGQPPPAPADARPLFDGQTLAGWEGSPRWRVEDGVITGGSLTESVPHNDFLASRESFADFDLRFDIRLTGGGGGLINSGVQVRSERAAKGHEMVGYQVDVGDGWWGKLYDEARRNKVIGQAPDLAAVNAVIRKDDWNAYVIRAEGPRLRAWINGVPALDYLEPDPAIPRHGRLGIQLHSGGKARVQVRDVRIATLTPAPEMVGAPNPPAAPGRSPLSAEMQLATFSVPPGFEVELVAAESEGQGKFITVDWDTRGRMWTMTAFEYPVDANENKARAAALYANPARDRVLVFDRWAGPGPHPARVFADGLAIPLGILPYRNGVYVQHGPDIAFLADTDGDGQADRRDVVLTGFGVQDSHLFPHQFTRAPGNWLWMAQGAFNYGKVRTTAGREIQFDQTRMAKFRADGSDFDITSNGPCNIWGLVLTDEGEAWIQEANDFGYPVMAFHEYANYPGCSDGQWKSYSPEFPGPAPDFRMGGTGLSGLALSDRALWPEPYRDVMYVANPITRKIQAIRIHPEGAHTRLEKLPDFVQSSDEWFRPVALRLGPDGCLYAVDWYNKIISHNEVPRTHPERDKTRGRIWRIKPAGWTPLAVPDFTTLPEPELLALLGGPNATQTHLAWQAIVDRDLKNRLPELKAIAHDTAQPPHRRIPALWAVEGLGGLEPDFLRALLGADSRNLRREAVRAVNELPETALDLPGRLALLAPFAADPDPTVRAEVLRTLGRLAPRDAAITAFLVGAIQPSLPGPTMISTRKARPIPVAQAYDREFERYIIRLFLEHAPETLAAFLASPAAAALPVEARLWAALALPPAQGGLSVAELLPRLQRPPNKEELLRLVDCAQDPAAAEAMRAVLANPVTREPALNALLEVKSRLDPARIGPLLSDTLRGQLRGDDAAVLTRAMELAGAFRLTELEQELLPFLEKGVPPALAAAALRALAEMGGGRSPRVVALLRDPQTTPELRLEAARVLAALADSSGVQDLVAAWPELLPAQRRAALEGITRTKVGAQRLIPALRDGRIAASDLDGPTVERLQTHLTGRTDLEDLLRKLTGHFQPVLAFNGKEEAWLPTELTLDGPFTLETWVRLEKGLSNQDGLFGAPNQIDINFHAERLRVYLFPPLGDVVAATRPIAHDLWTHVAVVRDAQNVWRLYLNGEPDAVSKPTPPRRLEKPRLAWTSAAGGLHGALTEYRIWDRALSGEEIRAGFDRSLDGAKLPAGLLFRGAGAEGWGKLRKDVAVTRTADLPPLLTAEAARALEEKFSRYTALGQGGDAARGKQLAPLCTACHLIGGQGVSLGPDLSGVGAMGLEAILRNLLTPNAAMEPGYRTYRVELRNGEIREGFLASDTPEAVVLRLAGGAEQRIARADIAQGQFLRRSLMPEGLLDALAPEQAADLLAYLQSLK